MNGRAPVCDAIEIPYLVIRATLGEGAVQQAALAECRRLGIWLSASKARNAAYLAGDRR